MNSTISKLQRALPRMLQHDLIVAGLLSCLAGLIRFQIYRYLIDVNWANKDSYCRAFIAQKWWRSVDIFPGGAWPPLPSVFNIAFLPFAGGDFLVSSTYAVIFFGAISIGLLYLLSRSFAPKLPSLSTALIAAVLWPHISVSIYPLSEAVLIALLLTGSIFFIKNHLEYAGIFFALASLTRIEALFVLGSLYAYFAIEGYRRKSLSDLIRFVKWSAWGWILLVVFWIHSGSVTALFRHHFALIAAEKQFMDMSLNAIIRSLNPYPHIYVVFVLTFAAVFLVASRVNHRVRLICLSFFILFLLKCFGVINNTMLAEPRYFVDSLTVLLPFAVYGLFFRTNRLIFIAITLLLGFYNTKAISAISTYLRTTTYSTSIVSLVDYLKTYTKAPPVVVFHDDTSYNQCYVFMKSGLPSQKLYNAPNYHRRFEIPFPTTADQFIEYLLRVRPRLFVYPNKDPHYRDLFIEIEEMGEQERPLSASPVWHSDDYSIMEVNYD